MAGDVTEGTWNMPTSKGQGERERERERAQQQSSNTPFLSLLGGEPPPQPLLSPLCILPSLPSPLLLSSAALVDVEWIARHGRQFAERVHQGGFEEGR
jgi:hypothetical protein